MRWEALGVLTDEVSESLVEALDWAVENELKHVELRVVDGVHVMDMSDEALTEARRQVELRGLFISAIASPVFKCALSPERPVSSGDTFGQQEEDVAAHFIKLERALDIASLLGTSRIRIFSFWREQNPQREWEMIISHLREAAARAAGQGVQLLLENEPSCNGGYAEEVAELVAAVASPALRALWDPGNEAYGGRTAYPDGYAAIREAIGHVHLKDARIRENGTPECVPLGRGAVALREQLAALEEDGYDGLYTLETHYIPLGGTKREGTDLTLKGLRELLVPQQGGGE
ncbi:sugar phosphate isomerase/epimerase family protein [Paenibacillus daejeonensis]|uniref:sugar phosphate isomerase/epimerase family protein n=1 Tax=Paenibacillus daejeonensis TaxID=135193 RepID=UPI00037E5675|nr:sugar phosphate isomerase/epimerase family protein [Paenibacillus daejeonensis]